MTRDGSSSDVASVAAAAERRRGEARRGTQVAWEHGYVTSTATHAIP